MLRPYALLAGCALAAVPAVLPAGDLNKIITGSNTTAVGDNSLTLSTGGELAALGDNALAANTSGSFNTAVGSRALQLNTTGRENVAVGSRCLVSNTTGRNNTAVGHGSLNFNSTGARNSAFGHDTLKSVTTGTSNTAVGMQALRALSTGSFNTAMGYDAMHSAVGSRNTSFGHRALRGTLGNDNIAVGNDAGANITAGSNNIVIGNAGAATDSGTIRVGTVGTHTATFVSGIANTNLASGSAVYIDTTTGQLGTMMSTVKVKTNIKDMADTTTALEALRPVTFHYEGSEQELQFGLIAEEVLEHIPALVEFNPDGTVRGVQYHKLAPMLLNELQKQQRVIATLQDRLRALESKQVK